MWQAEPGAAGDPSVIDRIGAPCGGGGGASGEADERCQASQPAAPNRQRDQQRQCPEARKHAGDGGGFAADSFEQAVGAQRQGRQDEDQAGDLGGEERTQAADDPGQDQFGDAGERGHAGHEGQTALTRREEAGQQEQTGGAGDDGIAGAEAAATQLKCGGD